MPVSSLKVVEREPLPILQMLKTSPAMVLRISSGVGEYERLSRWVTRDSVVWQRGDVFLWLVIVVGICWVLFVEWVFTRWVLILVWIGGLSGELGLELLGVGLEWSRVVELMLVGVRIVGEFWLVVFGWLVEGK
ncbi:hypothetical protein DM860_015045 [Cuscuta australis]|uniref:Uncharacterized protein n=1 Tax=Cuscuta australis TaxID=267555 RepID=A0A328DTP5_9ASTE|nr:hypothetical protein DM860_015045 [Cuscuta australis]